MGPIPLREGFRLHYNPHPSRFDSPAALPARVVIAPNASLRPEQAVWFMVSISAVGLSIALVFMWMGFWPVLPIAGLELTALGAALWVSLRRNAYREVVDVNDGHVIVEMGRVRVLSAPFAGRGHGQGSIYGRAPTAWRPPSYGSLLERSACDWRAASLMKNVNVWLTGSKA